MPVVVQAALNIKVLPLNPLQLEGNFRRPCPEISLSIGNKEKAVRYRLPACGQYDATKSRLISIHSSSSSNNLALSTNIPVTPFRPYAVQVKDQARSEPPSDPQGRNQRKKHQSLAQPCRVRPILMKVGAKKIVQLWKLFFHISGNPVNKKNPSGRLASFINTGNTFDAGT
ncbi:hypothetical protein NTD84_01215 [Pseudomonas sp. 14P_8.1_Bac3]|uniref:hypothetical protein n=1 Tax=Pseudomonas sp. 14P_8.1_Bac3 TaxID=2971621 RepID=UPI0021C60B7E|nr:hypothetical protein [Pseudomonas sp. 14P_8.1_Bac3]MCU1758342.1 hypothetical protein [Pseudomonas sp. 14P_8.1_Bac3]